jgi:putative membrane protein
MTKANTMIKKSTLESIIATIIFAAIVIPLCAQAQIPSAQEFVTNAAIGGMFEVQSSQIALDRSNDKNVRKFARMMVNDHTKVNDELKTKMQAPGETDNQLPTALDAQHQAIIDQLKHAAPENFDRFYIQAQVDAHTDAVNLFRTYAKAGDDQILKTFAIENLPTLQMHLSHIKTLQLSQ